MLKYIDMMLDGLTDSRQYDKEQADRASEIGMRLYHNGKAHAYDVGISLFELLTYMIDLEQIKDDSEIIMWVGMMMDQLRNNHKCALLEATGATEFGMKMYHDGEVHAYDHCIDKFKLLKELVGRQ